MKVSLKADTGKWVSRCNNCNSGEAYPDSVTIHIEADANELPSYAIFELIQLDNGNVAFKADTGKYVSRCNNCATSATPDIVTVHMDNCDEPYAQFTPILLANGKYAFKADTGNYLSRCNNCIAGAAYPDSLMVHAGSYGAPYEQFTMIVHL